MFRNLFVFIFLTLNGCILYVDDTPGSHNTYRSSVSLESPYISCTYDAYWDLSEWTFEIYADSFLGPSEVFEVGFWINDYDYQYMEYLGGGWWYRNFVSNYYDCDRYYHFDFFAVDYDGYEGFYTLNW